MSRSWTLPLKRLVMLFRYILAKDVASAWRQNTESNEKHSLLSDKTYSPPIGIRDVSTFVVEGDFTVLSHQLVNGDDRAVDFGMLKFELKSIAIVLLMHHLDFSEVGREIARCRLVAKPGFLPSRRLYRMLREGLLAVSHCGLRAGVDHRPYFAW